MADTADSSISRVESAKPPEYSPANDPTMRRVVLQDDITRETFFMRGRKTDIQGAKVPLDRLHTHNIQTKKDNTSDPRYTEGYFQTHSGTIYQFREEEEKWIAEGIKSPRQFDITGTAVIEVGKRFQSPKLINGIPELDTSPIAQVILVDGSVSAYIFSKYNSPYSNETSDIPQIYHQQKEQQQQNPVPQAQGN